jgi:CDP-paratose 2-epimerase
VNILVTGGCGFIGSNVVSHHLKLGHQVTLFDNLSRVGTEKNLKWIESQGKISIYKEDVRNADALARLLREKTFDIVYHLAGQVAVTTSVVNPRNDFEINALGTVNVLEAMRLARSRAVFIYASTNKVYGDMEGIKVKTNARNVRFVGYPKGIPADYPLDFHSPYGCSKGAADQYVRDYHRIYGLNTVVFRQSCVYGERQFGVEDQGWVAHFIIQNIFGRPLHIYGNGKQVRDVLYVGDLIAAYDCAWKKKSKSSGRIYNIGGGAKNQISLLELIERIEKKLKRKIPHDFQATRPGDQAIYVSDNSLLEKELGWRLKTNFDSGFEKLISWVEKNKTIFNLK